MEPFQELKNQLVLDADNRVMLGSVAMILMPAWFFTGILQRVVKEAGSETAKKIYYNAGYDGAYPGLPYPDDEDPSRWQQPQFDDDDEHAHDDSAGMGIGGLSGSIISRGIEMAREATELLLKRIAGGATEAHEEIVMPTQLIVRKSSGESLRKNKESKAD